MPTFDTSDLLGILPAAILAVAGIVLVLTEAFLGGKRRGYQAWLSIAFGAAAFAASVAALDDPPRALFGGAAAADGFAYFVSAVVNATLVVTLLAARGWLAEHNVERGEFYALMLFAASGMLLLAQATDLIVLFVALEVMSLSTYALAAYLRRGERPPEAAFKYFVLGSFSSALFLYGAALTYGAVGSTLLADVSRFAAAPSPLLLAGLGLMASGFAFKVAAVPFHTWAPDVYEGSPTPVAALMASAVKAAAFAALARVFAGAFGAGSSSWLPIITWLAILTMVVGNLLALPQRSVKRMLAYSSISHAGYLLVAVAAAANARSTGIESMLFYLAAYAATAIGAFIVVAALERAGGVTPLGDRVDDIDRYAGLAARHPFYALAMAAFMLSLGGIPPSVGFAAKLFVIRAAVETHLYPLAIVAVLSSVIGVYYYLRVVVAMYMRPSLDGAPGPASSTPVTAALACCLALVIWLGIGPGPLAELARASATALGAK